MPTGTLNALLRALDDPEGGGAVHALHAPDALLPVGGGLVRVGDLDRDAYAAAFMADGRLYPRVRPDRPRGPMVADAVRLRTDDAGEGRSIHWFTATEARTGTPLHLALGVTPAGVAFATLAREAHAWGWQAALDQTLADLPYGRGLYPRSWLDAAWQRLHGHARPAIATLPEAAFACQGSGDCCKVDWPITVEAAFQPVLDAMGWGVELPRLPDGRLAVKTAEGTCPFLEGGNRCAVHRRLGRPLFPTCALYPFAYAQTPDGLAFSTSALCGAARAGIGPSLAERHDELWDRVAIADVPPLRTPVYRLRADVTVPWARFAGAEAGLLDALAGPGPLAERLWAGTRGLVAAIDPAAGLPTELPPPVPGEQRAAIAAFLGPWLEHLGLDPAACEPRDAALPEAALLGRVLRNLHFSKVLSFHFDLATSHAVAVAIWLLVRHARAAHGAVPDAFWSEVGKMFMHGAAMRPYLGDDADARARRAMLGDPAFSGWLLGY